MTPLMAELNRIDFARPFPSPPRLHSVISTMPSWWWGGLGSNFTITSPDAPSCDDFGRVQNQHAAVSIIEDE